MHYDNALTPTEFRKRMAARRAKSASPTTSRQQDIHMIHLLRLRWANEAEPNKLAGLDLDTLKPVTLSVVVGGEPALLDIRKSSSLAVEMPPMHATPGYWQDLVLQTADALCQTFDGEKLQEITAQCPQYCTATTTYNLSVTLRRLPVAPLETPKTEIPTGENQVTPTAEKSLVVPDPVTESVDDLYSDGTAEPAPQAEPAPAPEPVAKKSVGNHRR